MIEFNLNDEFIGAGQPDEGDLRDLKSRGIRSVVNLRLPDELGYWAEERVVAEQLGLSYLEMPVNRTQAVCPEVAAALHATLASLSKPVVVHCASSNRVGALVALISRFTLGCSIDDALAQGKKAGLRGLWADVERAVRQAGP